MKIFNSFKVPFELAGAGVGMGIMGTAFSSPGLQQAGETTGKFIAPAINIQMGGYLIKQLKEIKNVREKEKKKR